jgi:hypothetical protein
MLCHHDVDYLEENQRGSRQDDPDCGVQLRAGASGTRPTMSQPLKSYSSFSGSSQR